MAMTDRQVDDMCRKLAIGLGVATTDDLVKEMVDRFLSWKLPKGFCPDAGISFKPTKPYEGDEYGNSWWPIGTNLLHAAQAEEMVRHMLGLSNKPGNSAAVDHSATERSDLLERLVRGRR